MYLMCVAGALPGSAPSPAHPDEVGRMLQARERCCGSAGGAAREQPGNNLVLAFVSTSKEQQESSSDKRAVSTRLFSRASVSLVRDPSRAKRHQTRMQKQSLNLTPSPPPLFNISLRKG